MLLDQIREVLLSSDRYLSGEELGKRFGVTRAAVSLAVQKLREEGYVIEARHRRGYFLQKDPERLDPRRLAVLLGPEIMERVLYFSRTDSTNKVLSAQAAGGAPDGTYALADEQTAGRGRRGRNFLSPPGKGVYLSLLLRPAAEPEEVMDLTAWTAVYMRRAIRNATGLEAGIKWVNDLILEGRKTAGILSEMALEGESRTVSSVIIGIGVNVNEEATDFPSELQETAGSLRMSAGKSFDRTALAAEMILQFEQLRKDWPRTKDGVLYEYRRADVLEGKRIRILSGNTEEAAAARGISEDFGLIVEKEDGSRDVLRFGEVSIRGTAGYVPGQG